MVARWKKTSLTIMAVLLFGGAGALTGAVLQPTVTPEPAAASCEDDECEGGNKCSMNTTTSCDVVSGGCKTVGCNHTLM